MADDNERFVEFANPHSWFLTAENLHEQATLIYERRSSSSILTRVDGNNRILERTRGIDSSVFLLCGFALENAIKAFLVYENPSWVSNGRLSKKLRSHSLTGLQKLSALIPYKKRHAKVLQAFESGLDSWFRYPCALTIEDTKAHSALHDALWDGYVTVMHAYGRKLCILLGKGWRGPHGGGGRWIVRGEYLGYATPTAPRIGVTVRSRTKQ